MNIFIILIVKTENKKPISQKRSFCGLIRQSLKSLQFRMTEHLRRTIWFRFFLTNLLGGVRFV